MLLLEIEASSLDNALTIAFGRLSERTDTTRTYRVQLRSVEMKTHSKVFNGFLYILEAYPVLQ